MVQLVDSEDEVENSVTEKPIRAKARPLTYQAEQIHKDY